jgi:hypothetical protein
MGVCGTFSTLPGASPEDIATTMERVKQGGYRPTELVRGSFVHACWGMTDEALGGDVARDVLESTTRSS